MIKQLLGHITDNQIEEILEIIKSQYCEYLRLIGSEEYNKLFSQEYQPHNKQHSVSWAISSAFPSNKVICGNLQVSKLIYGKGHTRPTLQNEHIEIHILNQTTHFDADYLKIRYKYNANQFANKKLFAYIKFGVEKNRLVYVNLCLPNERGEIVVEKTLLSKDIIIKLAT